MRRLYPKTAVSILIILIFLLISGNSFAQLELLSASHPVYDFLKRMQLEKVISGYNSSLIPISRNEVAGYLKIIKENKQINSVDRKILEDYLIEFEYDISKTRNNSTSLVNKFEGKSIFGNKKQKYFYSFADSNATLFMNVPLSFSSRGSNGDIGNNLISLGELGLNLRGSLYNKIGYSISFTGGQRISGNDASTKFEINKDPFLKSNPKFLTGNNYYDYFSGHVRFQTPNNWFALTVGREPLLAGYGYIDRMFISNNTIPMDFLKLDLNYKKLKYTFSYGSISGDSLGMDLKSKNIAFHRLNIQFSDALKIGYYESVIMSDNPFSFVYLNPISFITSADLNSGAKETTENNTLMGLDIEVIPFKNVAVQGTLLVDDINFSTLFKNDISSNDNKLGYQLGTMWTKAFTIPNLTFILEYTRLNPFVYTHRFNKDAYANWGLSLGHALPPNSDEIALKFNYNISNRAKISLKYQFQRSADGIYYDSVNKQIINYGGNLNRGDGDKNIYNTFLLGDRTNRNIFTANIIFEPIKQYFLEFMCQLNQYNLIYLSKKEKEAYFRAFLKILL